MTGVSDQALGRLQRVRRPEALRTRTDYKAIRMKFFEDARGKECGGTGKSPLQLANVEELVGEEQEVAEALQGFLLGVGRLGVGFEVENLLAGQMRSGDPGFLG